MLPVSLKELIPQRALMLPTHIPDLYTGPQQIFHTASNHIRPASHKRENAILLRSISTHARSRETRQLKCKTNILASCPPPSPFGTFPVFSLIHVISSPHHTPGRHWGTHVWRDGIRRIHYCMRHTEIVASLFADRFGISYASD
jgi:hypothetical protein